MFRPATVHLYKIFVQREQAFKLLTQIAKLKDVNLIDTQDKPLSEREYYNQMKRCEDLCHKLGEINSLLHLHGKEISYCPNYEAFIEYANLSEDYVIKMELNLSHRVQYLLNQSANQQQMVERLKQIEEEIAVVLSCKDFIYKFSGIQLGHIIGCINTSETGKFNRIVFRVSRANGVIQFTQIENNRSIFIIVFSQGQHQNLKAKLLKICETFNTTLYQLPNEQDVENKINDLKTQKVSLEEIISTTKLEIDDQLDYFADIQVQKLLEDDEIYFSGYCSYICELKITLDLILTTYFHLSFFESKSTFLIGSLWCSEQSMEEIKQMGFQLEVTQDYQEQLYEPPSLMKINDFTFAFQELVNTYGIPRYGEINPGLFTIVTFPFLFGIMFGDIGHGALLTLFGFYLLFFGQDALKKLKLQTRSQLLQYQDFQTLYQIRYLITLMGLCAFYCGFIYNDFFSTALDYRRIKMGFDGKWSMSEQHLSVMNSFKMKTAIVIGVIHMVFGILLKGWNCLYQKQFVNFFFSFIPELAFMISTFGYMSFLIIIKWLTNFDGKEAPSIITTLLNMVFTLGGIKGAEMYPNQVFIQTILMKIAVFSPLIMLLRPFIILLFHNKRNHDIVYDEQLEDFKEENEQSKQKVNLTTCKLIENRKIREEKHFEFTEIYIESLIECIEFILGAVSNTASYLRLWALSLAHSQLSEVFFQMAIQSQIEQGSVIGICLSFTVFAGATFGVLMCMDTLECFLHSLRLHWVEFQSKFYKGDGYAMQPFNYLYLFESKQLLFDHEMRVKI